MQKPAEISDATWELLGRKLNCPQCGQRLDTQEWKGDTVYVCPSEHMSVVS